MNLEGYLGKGEKTKGNRAAAYVYTFDAIKPRTAAKMKKFKYMKVIPPEE
jgi:hypothetical protein